MKKYKTIILMCIFTTLGMIIGRYTSKNDVYEQDTRKIKNNNTISMMLETDTNSKTYIQSTDSTWPSDGYMFNEEMSKCEQGSKLSWDDTNKKVIMEGNVSDKCYVFFDKYNPIRINSYTITPNGNKITISISATSGTGTITKYLYSKDNGVSYVQSANNTYTFTGLDKGTYNIKAYVQDSNGKNSEIIYKTIEITSITLADYVKSLYTGTQGANNIYHHTSTLTNGAGDNSYRYAGASDQVNNYVCFGSSTTPCPADNLYRIIGVFGENNHGVKDQQLVKVIKNTSYGLYKWNVTGINDWAKASLNTTLNSTFKTEKLSGFEDKIAEVTWRVSGYSTSAATVKTVYTAEITNATKTHTAKIGLMYPSDYEYATTPDYWTTNLFDYDTAAKNKDWLFLGSYEWLLSPGSGDFNGAWNVNSSGRAYNNGGVVYASAVRPSFYLLSSVKYVSGSGTSSLPIRIN